MYYEVTWNKQHTCTVNCKHFYWSKTNSNEI